MKNIVLGIAAIALLVAIGVCSNGCSLRRYATSVETGGLDASKDPCIVYDDSFLGWTIAATVAGSVSTGAGTAATIVENDDAELGLMISSAGLAAIATAAGLIAAEYAARYEECVNGGLLP